MIANEMIEAIMAYSMDVAPVLFVLAVLNSFNIITHQFREPCYLALCSRHASSSVNGMTCPRDNCFLARDAVGAVHRMWRGTGTFTTASGHSLQPTEHLFPAIDHRDERRERRRCAGLRDGDAAWHEQRCKRLAALHRAGRQ